MYINKLNNVQIQKRFIDFHLLINGKQLVVKRKFEKLKFANDKQKCRFRN